MGGGNGGGMQNEEACKPGALQDVQESVGAGGLRKRVEVREVVFCFLLFCFVLICFVLCCFVFVFVFVFFFVFLFFVFYFFIF